MRAKFKVDSVLSYGTGEELTMSPVCPDKFGPNGEHPSEDNSFARWTPSGVLKISIQNPALLGKFKPGQKFYLDFTKAPE